MNIVLGKPIFRGELLVSGRVKCRIPLFAFFWLFASYFSANQSHQSAPAGWKFQVFQPKMSKKSCRCIVSILSRWIYIPRYCTTPVFYSKKFAAAFPRVFFFQRIFSGLVRFGTGPEPPLDGPYRSWSMAGWSWGKRIDQKWDLYNIQPKQCTIIGEIPQNYHTACIVWSAQN